MALSDSRLSAAPCASLACGVGQTLQSTYQSTEMRLILQCLISGLLLTVACAVFAWRLHRRRRPKSPQAVPSSP